MKHLRFKEVLFGIALIVTLPILVLVVAITSLFGMIAKLFGAKDISEETFNTCKDKMV